MNYEQARQIGPNGPAPGKWNWTNMNDSIQKAPFTVAPCAWPDFEWPEPPLDKPLSEWPKAHPTGRERCDHDTQEEAERHHYEYDVDRIRWQPVDSEKARTVHRCDFDGCTEWATTQAHIDGWPRGDWCAEHATLDAYRLIHPFVPGGREIHS